MSTLGSLASGRCVCVSTPKMFKMHELYTVQLLLRLPDALPAAHRTVSFAQTAHTHHSHAASDAQLAVLGGGAVRGDARGGRRPQTPSDRGRSGNFMSKLCPLVAHALCVSLRQQSSYNYNYPRGDVSSGYPRWPGTYHTPSPPTGPPDRNWTAGGERNCSQCYPGRCHLLIDCVIEFADRD